MQSALTLHRMGIEPLILERGERLGGKVCGWHRLFPSFTPAGEIVEPLADAVAKAGIKVLYGAEAVRLAGREVGLSDGRTLAGDAVIACTGYELFDARIKEEYGYGIYNNVFTSADLERMFEDGRVLTASGRIPERAAFLHCVGSRDEKVGQHHCSRVCCITGVKQAVELKTLYPGCDVYNFYMDIRMFGPGYEELYREAQLASGIHFVRGRISEASQTLDGRVQIKAEDTLVGRPLKMTVDMLVLLVGMCGGRSNRDFAAVGNLRLAPSGFMRPADDFAGCLRSDVPGVFYAGTVTAPRNIGETMSEASAAACRVAEYLNARQ